MDNYIIKLIQPEWNVVEMLWKLVNNGIVHVQNKEKWTKNVIEKAKTFIEIICNAIIRRWRVFEDLTICCPESYRPRKKRKKERKKERKKKIKKRKRKERKKSFKLGWPCHQLLSGFLGNCHTCPECHVQIF